MIQSDQKIQQTSFLKTNQTSGSSSISINWGILHSYIAENFFFLSGNQSPHVHKMSLCLQIDQNDLPFPKFPKIPTSDIFPPT